MRYTGQGAHNNDVGAIQGDHPAPRHRRVYYYEMQVNEAGERGLIGLGFADKAFKMGKQPGYGLPSRFACHCKPLACLLLVKYGQAAWVKACSCTIPQRRSVRACSFFCLP